MTIDLNCDLGEGSGRDAELMPLITSANIACGAHAGSPATMRESVALAQRHGVAIGAHPGFADAAYFGRREIEMPPRAVTVLVAEQIQALRAIGMVTHVKPHGALYNLAARDRSVARAIVDAVVSLDPALVLFGLAGSELVREGRARGLRVLEEVFADRRYEADGALTSRSIEGAVIADERIAVAQVLQMVHRGSVQSRDGKMISITADTVCLHGDTPATVAFARGLRRELECADVELRSYLR